MIKCYEIWFKKKKKHTVFNQILIGFYNNINCLHLNSHTDYIWYFSKAVKNTNKRIHKHTTQLVLTKELQHSSNILSQFQSFLHSDVTPPISNPQACEHWILGTGKWTPAAGTGKWTLAASDQTSKYNSVPCENFLWHSSQAQASKGS